MGATSKAAGETAGAGGSGAVPEYFALPAGWSAPLAARLSRLARECAAAGSPGALREAWESALADVPDLLAEMDVGGLADFFERSLGAHAVAGLATSALARVPAAKGRTALAAVDPAGLGIRLAPFAEAAAALASRRAVASVARTAEWAEVPAALRRRAFFSAGVESARWLESARDLLERRLRLERERLENGKEAWLDRDAFVRDARRVAAEVGLPAAQGAEIGTLRDIRSLPRLRLIYEVQNAQAAEGSRRRADMSPEALDLYPAYGLERVESRSVPRPEAFWDARWRAAGGSVGWRGAARSPRVALKSSPIWQALGDMGPFGNPYPPFEWGSGIGVADVGRAEAEGYGLLRPGQPVPPGEPGAGAAPGTGPGTDAGLEAAVPVDGRTAGHLRRFFGDQVEVDGGVARWRAGR